MSFKYDLNMEEEFFQKIFKPYLLGKKYNLIWIYYDENNVVYKDLQKQNDIDIILDTGEKNITLSLKTVRKNYKNIFFETISNCNTMSKGWGYYSKADFIIYTFGYPEKIESYKFKISDVLKLDIEKYSKGYGQTEGLYKTEGRLIPLCDFENMRIL